MWSTVFSYGGDMKWLLYQWTLLSQPKVSPCNQVQLGVCPGAAPQASSYQCHWWGIDNKQLLPPHQWSPQPSSLGSMPMRVEIASSNRIWLPILRKKRITIAGQKQRWVAKSFFLCTYYIIVWFPPLMDQRRAMQQHSKCPQWPAGIYYLLQSQEVHTKSSPGKQAMFYPPHDPLSSSSVKHFCHQRQGWLMLSEVGDELRGTSFQRKLISTERLWLLELCFKKAVLYCSLS